MILGCHVSMSAPEYVLGSVKETLSYGADALMLYTGAPQNTRRKAVSELFVEEARDLLEHSGIPMEHVIVHAPYVINPANSVKPEVMDLARSFLIEETRRTAAIGASYMVLHPGSFTSTDLETGIQTAAQQFNAISDELAEGVTICLETMAGKGSEIGFELEQLAELLSLTVHPEYFGFCLDTCHMNDAGYDISDFDALLNQFDHILGLSNLKVIHLNDSKNVRGARKDRHENIGFGTIGFEALYQVASCSRTEHIPKILETPYVGGKPPYQIEIAQLRSGIFDKTALMVLGQAEPYLSEKE